MMKWYTESRPKKKIIQEGDLVKIDAGLIYQGYHSDAARTYAVGEVSPEARQLMEVTKQSFFEGIKFAKAGNHLNDISKAIGAYAANIIMVLCVIWLDTESELIFMRIPRYQTFLRSAVDQADAGHDSGN